MKARHHRAAQRGGKCFLQLAATLISEQYSRRIKGWAHCRRTGNHIKRPPCWALATSPMDGSFTIITLTSRTTTTTTTTATTTEGVVRHSSPLVLLLSGGRQGDWLQVSSGLPKSVSNSLLHRCFWSGGCGGPTHAFLSAPGWWGSGTNARFLSALSVWSGGRGGGPSFLSALSGVVGVVDPASSVLCLEWWAWWVRWVLCGEISVIR